MKPRESSEIRSAIARLRAGERMSAALRAAFDAGYQARLSDVPVSACRLRRPDRRNAWLRGWLEAERVLSEAEAVRSLSPGERAKGLEALAVLRAKLPFLGADGGEQTS